MATVKLTKTWTAFFEDGHVISQPEDDRYSKHDDKAEWNPSAFRDVLEYPSKVKSFWIGPYQVDLQKGLFYVQSYGPINLERYPLTDRKLIYFRDIEQQEIDGEAQEPYIVQYGIGYEGKNAEGKVEKKVIYIDG